MKPITITPDIVAEVTGGTYHGTAENAAAEITSYVMDNREAKPGSLFFCMVGERVDGHRFAPAAMEAGAVCAVCEKPINCEPYVLVPSVVDALQKLAAWYRSQLTIPVIAVVGSVGKTTAKEMLSSVLSVRYVTHKTPKNLNTQLGVPLTVLSIRPEHEAAVIEAGISEFGQMDRLGAILKPDVVVFTTVASCHLEFLGDLDGVLRAKSEIFPHMRKEGLAVLSGDDVRLSSLEPGVSRCTFGAADGCTYRASDVESLGFHGIRFNIHTPYGIIPGEIPAFGQHLPLAAAAAAAVGLHLGLNAEEISEGFRHYAPVGGRANVRTNGCVTVIDDCYNANPASMAASLRSLCGEPGRKIAILGDMKELGPDSPKYHEELGSLASSLPLSHLLTCGPEARAIFSGAAKNETVPVTHFEDRAAMISALPGIIRKDDLVLVKASHSMQFEDVVAALLECQWS